ncbi:response regulator [Anaeromyxobacter paludicola]|uniref:DNA-binding response regulator n=1 Tax=Anaeromyxobacter paludicola TaxID=2918171 RepID=A0ABN6NE04_9BACT|nr:response regulator transcription factor [Anaeromyxobacter paludicola]BDG10832.1 DNA-binding response regulator [Anaeromyxobacter paludicola]
MLQILLADDHPVLRAGVRALLESHEGWRVCAECGDGAEAVRLAGALRPDVAIVDLSLPGLDGLEATRRVCRASPGTAVLLYTMHASELLGEQVRRAGGRAYVLKGTPAAQLVEAVEALAARGTWWASGAALRPPNVAARPSGDLARLTAREREVLLLLAEGNSNAAAARALGIGVKTVETHRGNLMLKLGLASAVELVHYAVRNRLVTP